MMLHPDRSVDAASIALRTAAYVRDGQPAGAAIPDLRVFDDGSGTLARYHPSTEVHGFVNLRPGPRTLRVSDPRKHWLPVEVPADAPDRTVLPDPGAPWLEVPLFPTLALPIPPAETVLWGVITSAGAPAPLAFVQVTVAGQVYRGATGPDGTYVLWLRHVPFSEGAPPPNATLLAAAALTPSSSLSAAHAIVAVGSPDFLARFSIPDTISVPMPVRQRTRADLTLS